MSSKKVYIYLTLLIFFIFPQKANAQVIINEINASEEWVELYKETQEALSLDGCTIYFQDTKSQDKSLTISDNFLEGENYKVIFTGKSVLSNSDPDTVSLECSTFSIDPVSYLNNISTKSYARVPNGTGSFFMTTQITRGTKNPDPTPEPTPTPSPTPTDSPIVQPTQTPTAIPKTATPKPIATKTPTPKPTPTPTTEEEVTNEPENIIGNVEIKEATPQGMVAGSKTTNIKPLVSFIFISLGVMFLGFAGFNIYKNIKSEYNNKTDENSSQKSS